VSRLICTLAAALLSAGFNSGGAVAQTSPASGAPPGAGAVSETATKPRTATPPQTPLSLSAPAAGKAPSDKASSSKASPNKASSGKAEQGKTSTRKPPASQTPASNPTAAKPPATQPPQRPPGDLGGASSPPSSAPPSAAPSAAAAAQPMAPIIVQPSPGQTALNAKQIALLERISNYLTNLRTLVGEFKQIAPDGKQSSGDFYLLKPGRVRFDYNPPSPIELIADGRSVVVRDRNLASQDVMAISQTPLRFLLADRIDLLRDTNVVAVYGDNVFSTVVIEERQIARGTYRVILMFDARTMELRQWVVTDPQGRDTTVVVYNLDTVTKPDPELFKIDYTRYLR
jgi:outer membrane lipoprotein-sorting protein